MRVVLDTNVLVSGLYFGGIPGEIVALIGENCIAPCFTEATHAELVRVLLSEKFVGARQKLPFSVADFLEEIALYSNIENGGADAVPAVIHEDPSDNDILACAASAQAFFIVSGDRHLLALGSYSGIPIVAPEAFIREIKK